MIFFTIEVNTTSSQTAIELSQVDKVISGTFILSQAKVILDFLDKSSELTLTSLSSFKTTTK
jgi:hydrogenase maturation factor